MNKPGEITVDRRSEGVSIRKDATLTLAVIEDICRVLGNINNIDFDEQEAPVISTILPEGHRFQCLIGRSARDELSLAIRCKHKFATSWSDFGVSKNVENYIKQAIAKESNIIISGATNTGKTTLLNMMLSLVDADRRVIACEDTPEVDLSRFTDSVGLIASRDDIKSDAGQDTGMVSWRKLYDHTMRVTPEHLIFGEISTSNAFAFLAALNSGCSGLMCTLHADSAHQAIHRKFVQNMAWSGTSMERVPEFLCEQVDVVIQIKRNADGFRRIAEIYEPKVDKYFLKNNKELVCS